MAGPLVSVCVPVWNREQHLEATLASISGQSYDDLEILVLDNASTDGSVDVAMKMARRDSRIRVLVNDSNIGGWPNYRRLLERARGEYVKFCNSDDLLSPNTIGKLAGWLADPGIGLAFARQVWVDNDLRPLPPWLPQPLLPANGRLGGQELVEASFQNTMNLIGCPTATMFRRAEQAPELWGQFGGQTFWVAGDLACWFGVLQGRDAGYVFDAPAVIRVHQDQETTRTSGVQVLAVTDWIGMALLARGYGYLMDDATLRTTLVTGLRALAGQPDLATRSDWTQTVLGALAQGARALSLLDSGELQAHVDFDFCAPPVVPQMDGGGVGCRDVTSRDITITAS